MCQLVVAGRGEGGDREPERDAKGRSKRKEAKTRERKRKEAKKRERVE